ncbi:30S ribosomal protein S6 [Methylobacterium oryzisoli]|uniref:30S ribosomal protein S6 n=1 Tax=Methylobacterium oryzisoli TaxID=3385502 RepID=UPI003891F14B
MTQYRSLLLMAENATPQQIEAVSEHLTEVVFENGGKVEKTEIWGMKSLAYRIKKNRKAHFALLNIDAPPAALAEMERQMRISEDILRFLTIRVEALEAEPSAMMQKRDRDEHQDRERDPARTTRRSRAKTLDPQAELDAYSEAILTELRAINERLEGAS